MFFRLFFCSYLDFPSFFAGPGPGPWGPGQGLGPGPAKIDGKCVFFQPGFQAVVRDFDYVLAASAAENAKQKSRDQVGR